MVKRRGRGSDTSHQLDNHVTHNYMHRLDAAGLNWVLFLNVYPGIKLKTCNHALREDERSIAEMTIDSNRPN